MNGYISEIWGWNEEWQKNDFAAHFNPEGMTVVYEENELVGYSHVENNNGQLYLRMMVIHPIHQKKGIGKKLLGLFISVGKKQSKSLVLEVFKINIEAKIFYEKYGFSVVSKTPASYVLRLNTTK